MKISYLYYFLCTIKRLSTTICILLTVFTIMPTSGSGQTKNIDDIKISLNSPYASVKDVLNEIEKATDFDFVFNENEILDRRVAGIHVAETSVSDILKEISKQSGLGFRQVNNNISVEPIKSRDLLKIEIPDIPDKIVSGRVISEDDGEGIPGATVQIKGTTQGTVTDFDGNFSLSVPDDNAVLVFSYVGFKTQEIVVGEQTEINITMSYDLSTLEEVVVVGYGQQTKQSLVGAIGVTKGADLRSNGNVSNLRDALTGSVPGLSVLATSGLAGGGDERISRETELLIRGRTTWNDASPLILVDGIERDMNDLDINDVESISVLKDASATAVFGVKGGNGVILITTKRGTTGKAKFTIESEYSLETPSMIVEPADLIPTLGAFNDAVIRSRRISGSGTLIDYYSDEEIGYYRDQTYPYAYPNNDWMDIVLKDFAETYRINASVTGGTERLKYFASASYNHVDDLFNGGDVGQGYSPNYNFDRINFRSNFDLSLSESTQFVVNFAGIHVHQEFIPGSSVNGFFGALSGLPGNSQVHIYEDGVYGAYNPDILAFNPMYEMLFTGLSSTRRTTINMDYTLRQKLDFVTEGLSLQGRLAWDNRFENNGSSVTDDGQLTKEIDPEFYLQGGYYDYETNTYMLGEEPADMDVWTTYEDDGAGSTTAGFGWIDQPVSYGAESLNGDRVNATTSTLYYELRLMYSRTFGLHTVGGTGVISRQEDRQGSNWPRLREDWVSRVTYNYDNRFFFEANGAYNGSERFGPGYKFHFFPSLAGGWDITQESFMEGTSNWLENLKVRYSWGIVGNDRVNAGGQWPYFSSYTIDGDEITNDVSSYGYPISNSSYTSYLEGTPGNPDLRWESAKKQNLGLDFSLLSGKISGSVDVFKENRSDILVTAGNRNVPPINGLPNNPAANIGETKSRGAEIEVTYRNSIIDGLNYWVKGNWSVARSEVLYREISPLTPAHMSPEGFPINQNTSSIGTHIIQSWDELYASTGSAESTQTASFMPGDLALLDYDADGAYEAGEDAVPFGYPVYPQNNYAFSFGGDYKGFQLTMQFVGVYNVTRGMTSGYFSNNEAYIPQFILDDTWTYTGSGSSFPALAVGNDEVLTGHLFEYDGSFLRLQSAQLGYNLPQKVASRLGFTNVLFYMNGRNLFVWTKMPDDGVGANHDQSNYPTKRQYNFGIRVQF